MAARTSRPNLRRKQRPLGLRSGGEFPESEWRAHGREIVRRRLLEKLPPSAVTEAALDRLSQLPISTSHIPRLLLTDGSLKALHEAITRWNMRLDDFVELLCNFRQHPAPPPTATLSTRERKAAVASLRRAQRWAKRLASIEDLPAEVPVYRLDHAEGRVVGLGVRVPVGPWKKGKDGRWESAAEKALPGIGAFRAPFGLPQGEIAALGTQVGRLADRVEKAKLPSRRKHRPPNFSPEEMAFARDFVALARARNKRLKTDDWVEANRPLHRLGSIFFTIRFDKEINPERFRRLTRNSSS